MSGMDGGAAGERLPDDGQIDIGWIELDDDPGQSYLRGFR
jgi:hypothetical protein